MMERDTTASRPSDDRISLAHAGRRLDASPQALWQLVQRLGIAHERVQGPDGNVTVLPASALEVLRPLVAAPSPGPRYRSRPGDRGIASPPGRVAGRNRARALADQQRLERRVAALEGALRDTAPAETDGAARARAEAAEAELARLKTVLVRERAARARLEADVPRLQRELGEQESAREWLERELAQERKQRALLARGLALNGAAVRAVQESSLEAPAPGQERAA